MYIHINAICNNMGRDKYNIALPIFHCFTGCDTTSGFFGKGKKSAWDAWKSYPKVTQAFLYVATHPHTTLTVEDQLFECFCIVESPFCQKNKTMETIPPTQMLSCSIANK